MTTREPPDLHAGPPAAVRDRPDRELRPLDAERERRLSRFTPRPQTRKVGPWHSRFVGVAKFVLPAVAVAILGVVALWPELQQLPGDDAAQPIVPPETDVGEVRNPRFYSTDADDRPYSIIAEQADQASHDADMIDLDAPEITMEMPDGQEVRLVSNTATYDRGGERVRFDGDVTVRHADGTTFLTNTAHVDIEGNYAWSDVDVEGHGTFGDISAEGFRAFDGGAVVVFTGRSRMVRSPGESEAR